MSIRSELAKLRELAGCFVQHPRLALRLLGALPYVVRGMGYAGQAAPIEAASGVPLMPHDSHNPHNPHQLDNPLRAFFDARTQGRGVWKWLHYFDAYHRHLQRFVGTGVRVMEIGVYSGGSLEMWRDYFGTGCRLQGVDIQAACRCYENEYTEIAIGDQGDRAFWRDFKARTQPFHVVIDDGGHRPEQQIVTLEEMLPHMAPGGVYICEDAHGVHNGFVAYMQGVVKNLHAISASGEPTPLQRAIESVHFYPYMTVIERSARPVERFEAPKHGTEWAPFSTA